MTAGNIPSFNFRIPIIFPEEPGVVYANEEKFHGNVIISRLQTAETDKSLSDFDFEQDLDTDFTDTQNPFIVLGLVFME